MSEEVNKTEELVEQLYGLEELAFEDVAKASAEEKKDVINRLLAIDAAVLEQKKIAQEKDMKELDAETQIWLKEKDVELEEKRIEAESNIQKSRAIAEVINTAVENGAKIVLGGVGIVAIAGILKAESTGTITSKALSLATKFIKF